MLFVAAVAPGVLTAQGAVKPAGVVNAHGDSTAKRPQFALELPRSIAADSAHGHPWRWVGTGAVVGGAAAGVAAAVGVARTDDAFFGGPAIAFAALAGGVIGGLVGGLAYLISH